MNINKFNHKQSLKLLAVIMLSDGYIHRNKSLRLTTSVSSIEQHKIFTLLCQKLFNKKPKLYFPKSTTYHLKWFRQSELFSVEAVNKLKTLSKTFKTSPFRESKKIFLKSNQPTASFLLNESEELKWAALKVWFDFDGSVTPTFKLKRKVDKKGKKNYKYYQVQFECEIAISETNPQLVKDLLSIFKSLGLNARIRKDNRNWSGIGGVAISEIASIKKFLNYGKLFTNTQISSRSRRFLGIPKKTIMSVTSEILENYPTSKYFINKKKAFKYRIKMNKILTQTIKKHSPVV